MTFYWSRSGSYMDLLIWLSLTALSSFGSWLMCVHIFNLRPRERLYTAISCGLLLFILFANLFTKIIPISTAFWASPISILVLGLLSAWRSDKKPKFPLTDFLVWKQILAFLLLFLFFTGVNRGLAIYDDYANLPIVSTIAIGDIPPHFYLNPAVKLDYHYALHLLAASLVRVGGLYPWSALDVYKSLSIALAVILAYLWYRRYFRGQLVWLWIGIFTLFASGTRWLLLFLPANLLQLIGARVHLLGSGLQSGADLYTALLSPWRIAGSGPLEFPFAFTGGLLQPLTLSIGSSAALAPITLFLLLARRRWQPSQGILYGVLLASTALISESNFIIIFGGILVAALIHSGMKRNMTTASNYIWVLLPGLVLVPFMGGVMTEIAQRWINFTSENSILVSPGLPALALRWPPAIVSAHLGELSLFDPSQLLVALAEIGPALLIAPLVSIAAWSYIRSRKIIPGGIALMAVLVFLIPLFIRFLDRDRDISRLTATALSIWIILGFPHLWIAYRRGKPWLKFTLSAGFIIAIVSGLSLLPSQIVAFASPQLSYFIQEPDALMHKNYWDKLDKGAWVLDIRYPYRPVVLFGRTTGPTFQTLYLSLPEFRSFREDPDPNKIAAAGYEYVYIDRDTWQDLNIVQRQYFQAACVKQIAEYTTRQGDFRRLLNIQMCNPGK